MRVRRESASEVVAHCGLALYNASAVVEQAERDGRDENGFVVVMIEDAVKIVGIPRIHPFLGELTSEGSLNGQRHFLDGHDYGTDLQRWGMPGAICRGRCWFDRVMWRLRYWKSI